jgi:glycosyltransferase involved in cell wall biosynthesis
VERHFIGIIIPAFNEAETIEDVVFQAKKHGVAIVIDDGSRDGTCEKALSAGAQVYRHKYNRGYENALNSGFSEAARLGCKYILTMDADGQHNPGQLKEFIDQLDLGYDLVLGCRNETQRFSELVFAFVGRVLWNVSDPLCGLKAYQIKNYLRLGSFNTFPSLGTELAMRSIVSGASFIELPIVTRKRVGSSRFGSGLQANIKILRALAALIYRYLTNQLELKSELISND